MSPSFKNEFIKKLASCEVTVPMGSESLRFVKFHA